MEHRLEQAKLEQAKKVVGDWLRMKAQGCKKRVEPVREFLRQNGLVGWSKRNFPPTITYSDPIPVYDRHIKVVGVFGEVHTSDFIKQKEAPTCESEGVDALIFVFIISSYGWIQFWWEGAWAGRYSDPYGLDCLLPQLLALNCPNLVKVVGDILDEGVKWWEKVYERALEVVLRQLESQATTLNEMVIDLQLGGRS